jgi:hypothetical protein
MAYDPTKLRMIAAPGIDAGATWIYGPGDAHATVEGAGYFSNGGTVGMKVGDLVFVIEAAAGGTTAHSVTAVAAANNNNALLPGFNPPGAATISAMQVT